MLIDQADRLAPRYAHSYGASGARSRYRIRPATTPRIGSDVREVGRCGLSLKTHQSLPPWPPRLFQFGGQPVHIRLEPRPVSRQLGLPIGQRPQFIEHGCDVARHADLIGRPWPYHRRHGSHPSRRHFASRPSDLLKCMTAVCRIATWSATDTDRGTGHRQHRWTCCRRRT